MLGHRFQHQVEIADYDYDSESMYVVVSGGDIQGC